MLRMIDHAIGRLLYWLFNIQPEMQICQMCGLTFSEFDLIDITQDMIGGRTVDYAACESCAAKTLMEFLKQGEVV